jgi:hypothetical protein
MDASMELDDLHERCHRYGTATSRLLVQTFDSMRPARPDFLCYLVFSPGNRIWDDLRHHWHHSCIISLLGFSLLLPILSTVDSTTFDTQARLSVCLKSSFWYGTLDGVAVLHRPRYPSYAPTINDLTNIHTLLHPRHC